jgi:hypothetical protein
MHMPAARLRGLPLHHSWHLLAAQENGLMARWVGQCILNQPKLFQKAFNKAFASEAQPFTVGAAPNEAPSSESESPKSAACDPQLQEGSTSILRNFWRPGSPRQAHARGLWPRELSGTAGCVTVLCGIKTSPFFV